MNKAIIYSFLLLLYLVLSKSLAPSEYKKSYMKDETKLTELLSTSPASAILVDVHSTGLIIKTYYLKFRVVYAFQAYEELIVKSSSALKDKLQDYIGLSIYRQTKEGTESSYVPLPPGSIFVGNNQFGKWNKKDEWSFFRAYRELPEALGWGDFIMTKSFLDDIRSSEAKGSALKNADFGINGIRTQKYFPNHFSRTNEKPINWKHFIKNYFHKNFVSSGLRNE